MTGGVWLLDLLQRIRLSTRDQGVHALYRVFRTGREADVVPLPDPGSPDLLVGFSHVAAPFVIYVHHVPDQSEHCFRAVVYGGDGTGDTFTAGASGPLVPDPPGPWQTTRLDLLLQRVAWGKPILLHQFSPEKWALSASLRAVADAVERGELTDGGDGALEATELLRRGIAERIAVLRRAENPSRPIRVEGADDWHRVMRFAPFVGAVEWDDLDAETLGAELGYPADTARWWTTRGMAYIAQVDVPGVQELLDTLRAAVPRIGGNMWSWAAAFENSVTPHYVSPAQRWRNRWQKDGPLALLRLVRETQSARPGAEGTLVIGYRRTDAGELIPLTQLDIGPVYQVVGPELMSIPQMDAADGVLLIEPNACGWAAVAMNRDGEHGRGSSDLSDDAHQFLEGITEAEILSALRRILTGNARFDVMCSPVELARRAVLYGLARAFERANIGADLKTATTVIDLGLLGLLNRHIVPLLPLEGGPTIGERPDSATWEWLASSIRTVHEHISWQDVRLDALAEAWSVPLDVARWWGQEGLAGREAQCVPDETESMIRCAAALSDYADAAEIFAHVRARAQQLFGEDLPVLWNLVPQPRKMSDGGGTLSP